MTTPWILAKLLNTAGRLREVHRPAPSRCRGGHRRRRRGCERFGCPKLVSFLHLGPHLVLRVLALAGPNLQAQSLNLVLTSRDGHKLGNGLDSPVVQLA